MIVDASALLAILLEEEEGERFKLQLATGDRHEMSPVNYVEAAVRIERLGLENKARELDPLMQALGIEVVPVTEQQARLARDAYRRFGKGRHPARLNLGDCFAYALARARTEPLLYKGDDFTRTDIEAAL